MNLLEFLNYRKNCPLCSFKLNLVFHSKKRQRIKYEDNKIIIIFPMYSIKKNENSYQIGFFINPVDNSFFIEFYTKYDEKLEIIPLPILKRFSEFKKNLGSFKFYNYCDHCKDYHYESNYFDLNSPNIGDLSVSKELFTFSNSNENTTVYQLINNYNSNKSFLGIYKPDSIHFQNDVMELNLIKFSSKNEMIDRLNKLLLFT